MIFHIIAFIAGYVLDLIIGDPHWLYHPVRLIGNLIGFLDVKFLGPKGKETKAPASGEGNDEDRYSDYGLITVFIVCLVTISLVWAILFISYRVNRYSGLIVEALLTYTILATKSLKKESMAVYHALKSGSIYEGRRNLSMIVGRDTENLDEAHVISAAVETIAENTSDGVIAPMIFTAIGGPVLGYLYKAINTMDSMIGYKNDRYMNFGRGAAKLDDIVNYIPARVSAYIMILSAGVCSIFSDKYSMKRAFNIFKRDRYNHSSPNSAQTEAVCAGALGLRLAGDAYYFGKLVKKPFIGDKTRDIAIEDIKRANVLMYMTSFICFVICLVTLMGFYLIMK